MPWSVQQSVIIQFWFDKKRCKAMILKIFGEYFEPPFSFIENYSHSTNHEMCGKYVVYRALPFKFRPAGCNYVDITYHKAHVIFILGKSEAL